MLARRSDVNGSHAALVVAAAWLVTACVTGCRRLRRHDADVSRSAGQPAGRPGRRATAAVATLGALTAIGTVAGIRALPGLVDVGYLGWMPFPPPVRLLLHLPLATCLLAGILVALLAAGARRQWWTRPIRRRDAALALALTAFATQLTLWHLVGLQP